jgi:uncharacterized protein with HEPN domain
LKRDPKSLLWDAREAANAIAAMTAGKSFADFDGDIVLRSAVERQFEIAGEALRQLARLDAALAAKVPDLRETVAFRNILIHGYAVIDRARVWQVVQKDLPGLRTALDDLLAGPHRRWERAKSVGPASFPAGSRPHIHPCGFAFKGSRQTCRLSLICVMV